MSDLDKEFKQMAEEAEQEEREKASKRGSGGFTRDYETIKWTGLERGKMKVIRAIGEKPDLKFDGDAPTQKPHDARIVRIAYVVSDKGKRMRVVLPLKGRDESHIMWRVISRVNEAEWIPNPEKKDTKKKVLVNQTKHPEIFNIINYNNLPESDPKRKFGLMGKGWMGKDYFIMNVVDRSMMEWHKANKHTALLSKNINVRKGNDGKMMEFVEEGIPAFGFVTLIQSALYKYYGYWGKYDIGIERTGLQTNPYRVINASKNPEQVPESLQSLVASGMTSEEELSWATFDISKLFQVSSYTKLWNNLNKTFAQIDRALGTNYFEELKKLASDEAAERKAKNETHNKEEATEDEVNEAPAEEEETPVRAKPTAPVAPVATPSATPQASGVVNSLRPPAFDKLTEKEKASIVGAVAPAKEGDPWVISYTGDTKRMGKCPDCSSKSPQFFATCPSCGLSFIF